MNFSEFKKLIGADPWNRDSETLRARHSAPEFEAAADEAEAFERKLQSALQIQAPDDLLGQIKEISQQPDRKRNWIPLSLAASLLILVGAAGLVWKQSHQWDSVEAYIADHYSHDGSKVVALADVKMPDQDVNKVLARLDATADKNLSGLIRFVKYCPTPDGRGAHMVVSSDQGPITIIYMPETQVTEGQDVLFDNMHAVLLNLEHGSAAVIAEQSRSVDDLVVLVRDSLKTGLVGA